MHQKLDEGSQVDTRPLPDVYVPEMGVDFLARILGLSPRLTPATILIEAARATVRPSIC